DLNAYNAVVCAPATSCLADRFQYALRFLGPRDIYHLSAEFTPGSALRFFGGTLDANDKLTLAASPTTVYGAGYHRDFTASGSVAGNVVTIRAPLSAFKLSSGAAVTSATAFAMAGPSEATELTVDRLMRTVDATPPFDAILTDATDVSVTKTDAPDPVRVNGALTYTIVIRNAGPLPATGVTMTDQLPKQAGSSSVTTTQGTCSSKATKGTVTCTIGTVPVGAQVTVVIRVKPTGPGTIVNTATVQSTTRDSNPANNTATATTTVTN
ncbi:MAG: hypothetical protein QOF49_277, partial [Chloroflexota bacterium]|nr:hypothetical protein [Chloroflexota bacterium]